MAYQSGDLHVTRLVGIHTGGWEYDGPEPEGTISLRHSCDRWEIGDISQATEFIRDLSAAIALAQTILATPPEGVVKRALDTGWNYYCRDHDFGTSDYYGAGGMVEHLKSPHRKPKWNEWR